MVTGNFTISDCLKYSTFQTVLLQDKWGMRAHSGFGATLIVEDITTPAVEK